MSVLGLNMSFYPYLRSAMVRFPFQPSIRACRTQQANFGYVHMPIPTRINLGYNAETTCFGNM